MQLLHNNAMQREKITVVVCAKSHCVGEKLEECRPSVQYNYDGC